MEHTVRLLTEPRTIKKAFQSSSKGNRSYLSTSVGRVVRI
jgi:hypothetical protein